MKYKKNYLCVMRNKGYSKSLYYSKFREKYIKNEIDRVCLEIIKSCSVPFIHEQIEELKILANAFDLKFNRE